MSDLLKKNVKKSNLLQRSSFPTPKSTFNRNDIYSIKDEPKPKKEKVKTTTIRCSQDVANLINALTIFKKTKSVDETLDEILNDYVMKLTNDEIQEIEIVKKLYDRNR